MKSKKTIGLLATGAIALSACSANYNTAFRTRDIGPSPNAMIMDAKQRAILSQHQLYDDKGNPDPRSVRRFCSEPSPDVFSVIAQSLGVGGSFSQSAADPAAIEAAINLAFSTAEQGSTIPRTQTVNMLREMMFRTCERYLSGGYDEIELSIQAARDQRIMVSILAIEQLTGAVTPRPVTIGAAGSASAGATGDAIVKLEEAQRRRDTTQAAYETAQTAYDNENKDDLCDDLLAKPEDEVEDDKKTQFNKCKELRDARDDKKRARDTALSDYQELSRLARTGGVNAQTTVEASAPGGLDGGNCCEHVADVADNVQAIVAINASDISDTMMFCTRMIRTGPSLSGKTTATRTDQLLTNEFSGVVERCMDMIQFNLEHQLARQAQLVDVSDKAIQRLAIRNYAGDKFDEFWSNVKGDNDSLSRSKLDALISSLDSPPAGRDARILAGLQNGLSQLQAQSAFSQLRTSTQNALSQQADQQGE